MPKILIVDDSVSMRQMLEFTLSSSGHDITQAEDGQIGLDVAKNNTFDLVITDVNMPNMDGITLVGKLRELDDYKNLPILVLTTESSQEKKMQGKAAGATGWIVKPFKPESLTALIQRVLGQ